MTLDKINKPIQETGIINGSIVVEDTSKYEKNIYRKAWFVNDTTQYFDSGSFAKNIPVFLYNSSGVPINWTLSDKDGKFKFVGLPEGEYKILVQKPGLAQINDPSMFITYPEEDTIDVFALIRSNDIVLNLGNIKEDITITAAPNPVKDQLIFNFAYYPELEFTISIYNLNGQLIYSEKQNKPAGETKYIFNSNDFKTGIYFIQIYANEIHDVFKILKL